jgi:hypothetical protein
MGGRQFTIDPIMTTTITISHGINILMIIDKQVSP